MNPQLQNWNNFCQYHLGEWHGTKTRYSPEGEAIKSWQVITQLEKNQDDSTINHKDYLTYTDGNTEVKSFGSYTKPITSALFLDNSFCWGSKKVTSDSIFVFEIGIRFENRRMLGYCKYDDNGYLQYISIGPEYLENISSNMEQKSIDLINGNWQGTLKKMTRDWIVSEPVPTDWKKLDDLNRDYLTLHFKDGVSLSCPPKIEIGKAFFIVVDWQIGDILLQRGIGYYDVSGFTHFTSEVFTKVNQEN